MEKSVLDLIAGFIPPNAAHAATTPAATTSSRGSRTVAAKSKQRAAGLPAEQMQHVSGRAGESNDGIPTDVHLVCFSKNRAFQLDQFLKSAKRNLLSDSYVAKGTDDQNGETGGSSSSGVVATAVVTLRISVLYLVTQDESHGITGKNDKQQQLQQRQKEQCSPTTTAPRTVFQQQHCLSGTLLSQPMPVSSGNGGSNRRTEQLRGNTHVSGIARPEAANAQDQLSECEETSEGFARLGGMDESYNLVSRRHPEVNFVRERPGEFCDQLQELVGKDEDWEKANGSLVLFAVDDMFFFRDFELADAARLLRRDQSTYCVHLRLHPGITWSHTTGSPCKVPPLTHTSKAMKIPAQCNSDMVDTAESSAGSNVRKLTFSGSRDEEGLCAGEDVGAWGPLADVVVQAAQFSVLTFVRAEGSGEWDYPWDLTGGLYRRRDAEMVLQGIIDSYGKASAANPNLVEFNGNRVLRPHAQQQQRSFGSSIPSGESSCADATVHDAIMTAAAATLAAVPRCGCAGQAVVVSLAVNRVQSTYSTPVYESQDGGVLDFNRRLWSGVTSLDGIGNDRMIGKDVSCQHKHNEGGMGFEGTGGEGFDESVYRSLAFNSVHVGELAFAESRKNRGNGNACRNDGVVSVREDTNGNDTNALPTALTVLLPVKNGGVRLLDAVASVIACCASSDAEGLDSVELLIIDDGSDDGAVSIAVAAANGDTEVLGPEMTAAAVAATCSRVRRGTTSRFSIRVIRHEQSLGLALSLNEGLKEAKNELVARMDADDVCMPERLKRQVAFMARNPNVSVLGSSVAIFSGECIRNLRNSSAALRRQQQQQPQQQQQQQRQCLPPAPVTAMQENITHRKSPDQNEAPISIPASAVHRIVRHPTDSIFLSWSLLFGCRIAHPSVLLRRSAVMDVGGYSRSAEPAEDYDLWLRLAAANPGCLANTGEVLLGLRKHEKNVSCSRREDQATAAVASAAEAMSRLVGRTVTETQAAAVRAPEGTADAAELAEAARLLGELEAAILEESRKASVNADHDDDTVKRATQLVRKDAEARLGAMAVHGMSRFGGGAAPVLAEWRTRYPGRPLLRAFHNL